MILHCVLSPFCYQGWWTDGINGVVICREPGGSYGSFPQEPQGGSGSSPAKKSRQSGTVAMNKAFRAFTFQESPTRKGREEHRGGLCLSEGTVHWQKLPWDWLPIALGPKILGNKRSVCFLFSTFKNQGPVVRMFASPPSPQIQILKLKPRGWWY